MMEETMTLEEITAAIRQLDDQTFNALSDEMFTMREERRARPQVEQAQAELVSELQEAGKLEKPEATTVEEATTSPDKVPAWENPLTDHAKMYLQGAVVAHNQRVWQSTHPGLNSWEPGAHGVDENIWFDITNQVRPAAPEENTASPGAIPFAPELPVEEGDLIEYEGVVYRVLSGHVTKSYWPPSESPSLFERV